MPPRRPTGGRVATGAADGVGDWAADDSPGGVAERRCHARVLVACLVGIAWPHSSGAANAATHRLGLELQESLPCPQN
jgi:hypothetical protein